MAEGLVDGAAFAVDASLIAADANMQRSAARSDDVDRKAIARTRRCLLLRLANGPILSTGIPHRMSVAGQSRHFSRAFGTAWINNASALLKPEAA
jgi:hypothetical protein